MNKFNSAAAFTLKTPLIPLPAACGRNVLLVHGPNPPAQMAMVSNGYDEVTDAISGPFSSQAISDNSVAYDAATSAANDALSTEDIVVGTILALILAFSYSFLNGQSSSSSFVSWPSQSEDENDTLDIGTSVQGTAAGGDDKTFNADNWKEISKQENYVLYNTKIRQKSKNAEYQPMPKINKKENQLVLISLLVLFVPIFSVEFFLALSRQFMCEMGMEGEIVQKLCSPLLTR